MPFFRIAVPIMLGVIVAPPVLFFLFIMLYSVFVDQKRVYDHNSRFVRFLLNTSAAGLCFYCNIRLHICGAEKLPTDTRFLLVSNHFSKFDPILTWYAFRRFDIAFISKPENFKVPFYGALIRKCCFLPIDRENPKNAIRTINRAAVLMKADEVSVGVYPEGQRNNSGTLLPFHNGLFRAAQKAEVPVVTMSVRGTQKIKDAPFIRRKNIYIDVLDVLPAAELTQMRTDDIGERARRFIEKSLSNRKGD